MCHQTIEKALKGVLVSRNPEEELPCIHKLRRLANLSGISEEMREGQLSLLDVLSPLNVEARYLLHFFRPPVFVVTQGLRFELRSVSVPGDRSSAG